MKKRPGVGAIIAIQVRLQFVAPHAVEVDNGGDIAGVEDAEQRSHIENHPRRIATQPAAQVVMGVDGCKPSAGRRMLLDDQLGARRKVAQSYVCLYRGGIAHNSYFPSGKCDAICILAHRFRPQPFFTVLQFSHNPCDVPASGRYERTIGMASECIPHDDWMDTLTPEEEASVARTRRC